jgi:acyl carrier protein
MTNSDQYKKTFSKALSIPEDFDEKLKYNEIPEWDSIGHMTLISELEEVFKVNFETDDIVDFSSFLKGKKILKKYGVEL